MTGALDDMGAMREALQLAAQAQAAGEVPVGAVVLKDGVVIGRGYNAPISGNDACAHAEIIAIQAACAALGNYRLTGCTMVVTLEPCVMCSGAILNARFSRLVFGAHEPKTGAAGSVINVFETAALNHQTAVTEGVLAPACRALMNGFFQGRREVIKRTTTPLREDALRTPDARFSDLVDWPYTPCYTTEIPALHGLRLHYVDEEVRAVTATPIDVDASDRHGQGACLLLHGAGGWGYQWRYWIEALRARGQRVLVPDLIGFGRSDKPKRVSAHSPAFHARVMVGLVAALGLSQVRVLDASGGLGAYLSQVHADVFPRHAFIEVSRVGARTVASAPFPDDGYRAAERAFAAASFFDDDVHVSSDKKRVGEAIRMDAMRPDGEPSARAAALAFLDAFLDA